MAGQPITYNLDYKPHWGQEQFHASRARFRVLACGRRWGKDRATIMDALGRLPEMVKLNAEKKLIPRVNVWFVAPTYPVSEQVWAELKEFTPKAFIDGISETDRVIRTKGGGELWIKSAEHPESLVGVGLDLLAMTEAASVQEVAWQMALRPTLSSPGRLGRAIFNGTPKGLDWFYRMYLRGQDPLDKEVESWKFPTSGNPYIRAEEIESAKKELPDSVFRQEYEAEFLAEGGQVFRHVDGCVAGALEEPIGGHGYVMGIDLAKHEDFTVLIVADKGTRRVVAFERFNQIDYNVQKEMVAHLVRKYNNARCWMDSTGVGDPILEDLQRIGVVVDGYGMTSTSKKQLIDSLIISMEQETLRFPPIPQLISELRAYEYETTKAGNIRMNAPSGYHDDTVVALALCNYGLGQSGGARQKIVIAYPTLTRRASLGRVWSLQR